MPTCDPGTETASSRTRRGAELAKASSAVTAAAALLLFLRFAPATAGRLFPPCPWKMISGLYCPGCGIARALKSLVIFDFASAFVYNPFLFIVIIPLFVYLTVIFLLRAATGKYIPSILSSPKAVMPVFIIIIGIWILRNVFPPPQ